MIDLLIQLTLGFTIALTGALIPGPLAIFVVTNTIKTGKKETGILAGLGHCIVEIAVITIIVLGLTTFLSSEQFQIAVNLIGGSAFIIFGILSFGARKTIQMETMTTKTSYNSIMGGVMFTIFNATIPLWWATTGLMMLNHALINTTILGVLFWVIGHWIADIAWFGFLGYSAYKGRIYFGEEVHRLIIKICGGIMIFLGLFFIFSTIL